MWQKVTRRLWNRIRVFSDERGVSLAESLIAVAVVGTALTALLAGLSTGSMAVQRMDTRVTAQNLARSQMEYIQGQTYSSSYVTMTPLPDGYSVTVVVSAISGRNQDEIQKIKVTVSYDDDTVEVEDFRTNR